MPDVDDMRDVVGWLVDCCIARIRFGQTRASQSRAGAWPLVVALALMALSFAPTTNAAAQSVPDSIRIPILVYHSVAAHHPGQTPEQRQLDVDTAVFRRQMSYIAEHGYSVISFAKLVDIIEGKAPAPERAVVITFDDGWGTQYRNAFPVLRQLGYTATFFVCTKPLGTDPLYMSWDQLREMQGAGMTIASHTRTHPQLTGSTDEALHAEIEGSRQDIQRSLGTTPDFFAYPYGAWDARVVAVVRAAGYQAARSLPRGPWNTPSELFNLRSVLVTDDMDAFERALGTAP